MKGSGGCILYWHNAPAKSYRVTFLAGHPRQWVEEEPHDLCDECKARYIEHGAKLRPWVETPAVKEQLEFDL